MACLPHPVQGHQQGPPGQLEITPRPNQLPFALPVPGGSPLPFLMPWTLPELTVTIWMVPLPGCPCSGICTERLLEGPCGLCWVAAWPTTQRLTLEEASWVSPSNVAAEGPMGVAAMGWGEVCHWWHPKWPQGFQSLNVPPGLAKDSLDPVLVVAF